MIAASLPIQRRPGAKLLVVDVGGAVRHLPRALFPSLLRPGDLVIANDAATLPASLAGHHARSGERIEVRLAGRESLRGDEVKRFSAIVFGRGDFRTRTEDRPAPPDLLIGDQLEFGSLSATITDVLHHPRFVRLEFAGTASDIWAGLARHGRPIQYAHVPTPLAVWDTWSPMAGPPVAFEAPSAGFFIDWSMLAAILARGAKFATLTHAAGISSTGDAALDALLPLDEPYRIPESTARGIIETRSRGARVIAIGTTVVRALEDAAADDGAVHACEGLADQRISASSRLRVVDAIVSGTHEPGTSHHELLRAFAPPELLQRIDAELETHNYLTHEFGDSVFLEAATRTSLLRQHGETQQRITSAHHEVLNAVEFVGDRRVAHAGTEVRVPQRHARGGV